MFCGLILQFSIALKLAYNKNEQTLHYWSWDMFNFDFLDKGLGIVSLVHFVYDFLKKVFLMFYSINWPNFTAWLSLLLEILGNVCIVNQYCLSTSLWRHGFGNKRYLPNRAVLSTWPKSHDKNLNILTTKRAFKVI